MVAKVVVVVMIVVIRVVAWVAELSLDKRFQVSLIVFVVRIGVVVKRPRAVMAVIVVVSMMVVVVVSVVAKMVIRVVPVTLGFNSLFASVQLLL